MKRSVDGKIERRTYGGTVNLQKVSYGQTDTVAPSRITDLKAEWSLKFRNTIILRWTAPGDDLDLGNGI